MFVFEANRNKSASIFKLWTLRSSHQRYSIENGVLKYFAKFTEKHLCQSLFIKKETMGQVFFCEICEIFKNTYLTEHLGIYFKILLNKFSYDFRGDRSQFIRLNLLEVKFGDDPLFNSLSLLLSKWLF